MICIKCGNQVPDGSLFCSLCGTKLEAAQEATAPPPQYAPPQGNAPPAPPPEQFAPPQGYAPPPEGPQYAPPPMPPSLTKGEAAQEAAGVVLPSYAPPAPPQDQYAPPQGYAPPPEQFAPPAPPQDQYAPPQGYAPPPESPPSPPPSQQFAPLPDFQAPEPPKKKSRKILLFSLIGAVVIIAAAAVLTFLVFLPSSRYNKATELFESKKYTEAVEQLDKLSDGYKDVTELRRYYAAYADYEQGRYDKASPVFKNLGNFKDSRTMAGECDYNIAVSLMRDGKYSDARTAFAVLGELKDSKEKVKECDYEIALNLLEEKSYTEAFYAFAALPGYEHSDEMAKECRYRIAVEQYDKKDYEGARDGFSALEDFKDSETRVLDCDYSIAMDLLEAKSYSEAYIAFDALDGYKDSTVMMMECRYRKGVELYEDEMYEEALSRFAALGDYKDSLALLAECERETMSFEDIYNAFLTGRVATVREREGVQDYEIADFYIVDFDGDGVPELYYKLSSDSWKTISGFCTIENGQVVELIDTNNLPSHSFMPDYLGIGHIYGAYDYMLKKHVIRVEHSFGDGGIGSVRNTFYALKDFRLELLDDFLIDFEYEEPDDPEPMYYYFYLNGREVTYDEMDEAAERYGPPDNFVYDLDEW